MSGRPSIAARRQALAPPQEWVRARPLRAEQGLPLLVEPAVRGIDLPDWAARQSAWLDEQLTRHGALLLRGFSLGSLGDFERFVQAAFGPLLGYEDRTSPRSALAGRIYTSTDHPAEEQILQHNENSYSHAFPLRIAFHCVCAPASGGETPLSDSRRVLERIEPSVRELFEAKGVLYVRNFGERVGLDWRTVFQADERAQVEAYCRDAAIDWEWLAGDRLRTRQVRPALIEHPRTAERCWFNQVPLFHPAGLPESVRRDLLELFAPEDLPSCAHYGDGTPIPDAVVRHLIDAYREETVAFPWEAGDIAVLDNLLVAHGRRAYTGARQVAVGMAQALRWPSLARGRA